MRISSRGILLATVLSLFSGVTTAASPSVDPNQLPKVECSSLRYSQEFLDKYPRAPAACLEARVYKGETYLKVKGKVYVVDKPALTFDVMDPYGNTLGTVTFKNPKSLRVIMDGKEVDASKLRVDENLTLWVPEAIFSAQHTAASQ
jgi:hypothetical protein